MKNYKTFSDFTREFPTNEACLNYLCDLKWGGGFQCFRCSHETSVKGRAWYYRRCQKCGYDESCTAQTLFHKIKFPLHKAFWIIYQLGTMKKGMSTLEISRQYGIHQETAWFFKRKVQQAMNHLHRGSTGNAADLIGSTRKIVQSGTSGTRLRRVRFANTGGQFSHVKNSRKRRELHTARLISDTSIPELKKLMAEINTQVPGNQSHERPGIMREKRKFYTFYNRKMNTNGRNNWQLFNLKNWLMGTHHRVSTWHCQFYLDEYFYRFHRRKTISASMGSLIETMITLPWMSYKILTCDESR